MRAIVLGASVKALACACELAIRGADVAIAKTHQQQKRTLGRKIKGFAFDTCESHITQPDALVSLFERAGRHIADYLAIVPVDPFARIWFEDGVTINVRRDAGLFALQLDQQFPHNREGANYCSVVLAQRAGETVRAREARWLITETHVACLTDYMYFQTDAGGTDAVDSGRWYTFGGVRQVGFALERLSAELGVEHHVGDEVCKEISGNDRSAARVDGKVMNADFVIDCDAKPRIAYLTWFLGINRRYPHLALNNVFLTQAGQEIRVTAPCALDPAHAPVGGDVLRIDIPFPLESDRRTMDPEVVLRQLKKCGMPDLDERIVVKQMSNDPTWGHDAGLAVLQGRQLMESIVLGPVDARSAAVTSSG